MRKHKWLAVLLAATMLFAAVPAFAGTVSDPDVYPLYADQDFEVGYIEVYNDATTIFVHYVVTEPGWYLTETHLAVADSKELLPTAGMKVKNLAPGQFAFSDTYDIMDEVTEAWFEVPIGTMTSPFAIAAHAVVCTPDDVIFGELGNTTGVSDATTMVVAGNVLGATYPHAAVLANAGAYYGVNTWPNQTGTGSWTPVPAWIWESMPVVNPVAGDIAWFEKTFDVAGTPTDGLLKIATDNGYAVWLNGKFVGSDNLFQFVGADFDATHDEAYFEAMCGDLKQAYVDTTTWQTIGQFNLAPYLQTGSNVLKIMGVNEYMNPDDGGQPVGGPSPYMNPGGMAFHFTADWQMPDIEIPGECETAWAAGTRFNTQGNWATWINYTAAVVTQPQHVQTLTWNSNLMAGIDSMVLENGVTYTFKVAGTTWNNRTFEYVDAKYCTADSWATWTDAPSGGYPAELLEVQVNSAFVNWGDYSATHVYELTFIGTGATVNFRVFDGNVGTNTPDPTWYGDNVGNMTIEIWK